MSAGLPPGRGRARAPGGLRVAKAAARPPRSRGRAGASGRPVAAAVLGALLAAAPPPRAAAEVAVGRGAVVRGLDKVSGETRDLELFPNASQALWRLTVTLGECRYPADDPASDAFARLTVRDPLMAAPAFDGWMIASSPALSAMDHARYDLWLIRCIID